MQFHSVSPRGQAWQALAAILDERQTLDAALMRAEGSEADRAFVRMLLLSALRHLGQIDGVLGRYLEKPLPAKRRAVQHALRLGVAQLWVLGTPAHAAVHETVGLVKRGRHAALAGMVNAVLKRISQTAPDWPEPSVNLPGWLSARWEAAYGPEVLAHIAQVAARRPPLDLCSGRDFPIGHRLDSQSWRMPSEHPPVPQLDGYAQGEFFVQDIAAGYPVRMLGAVEGRDVLDIGAAPGGKTAQLAAAGAQVTALDRSPARMERLEANMRRLGHAVNRVVADALEYSPDRRFDAIVLDAPCSATGTWRRHPEVVHITTLEDIGELAAMQRALLARAWEWLKPGGRLLYCVCSLEPEEGEEQIAAFLRSRADAALQPAALSLPGLRADGRLRTTPALLAEKGGMDGFFAAVLRKAEGIA